ncbi:MAG: alpha-galactosidase, partial [Clostridia bacterium]|nr:alpha-galactosidase [Clostridia bacterium]
MKKTNSLITANDNFFKIDTPNTTYLFSVMPDGHLTQHYYGKKIKNSLSIDAVTEKIGTGLGTTVFYSDKTAPLSLDNLAQEISTAGKGDFREPYLMLRDPSGSFVNDFLFESYEITDDFYPSELPSAHSKASTLIITTVDRAAKLRLKLYYSVFRDSDVIVKSSALTNDGDDEITIEKIASSQLDLPECDYSVISFDGAWAKERYKNERKLSTGIFTIDSKVGYSSNTHNPYVILKKQNASFDYGDCIGFNLVYTGNHAETFEVSVHEKTRIINGINPFGFSWKLSPGETFFTPEATLCYSADGLNGLTNAYHDFVNNHIVRGAWAKKERPVLVNNWEATGFNFTEEKLLHIALAGKQVGAELFVLDDGWFGNRTNDSRGLGDWTVNKERFPNDLSGFANKINEFGMDFGIWVEPEMINPDSDLYRAHPEWAVTHPKYEPSMGRNQLLLDLTNVDVQNYIVDSMTDVFSGANIAYVKWDFNRPMSDFYSPTLGDRQGEFFHRYMLGLYSVLARLIKKFPNILFESCASGGNRVDLGLLCYMPQFWCSDNTDSYDRALIQAGTLYGYPMSCMGAHVSGVPNAQTLRTSTIDNRFNTACVGLLGYELDLTKLNAHELDIVKKQIDFYKTYRKTLQYGEYRVTKDIFIDKTGVVCVTDKNKTQAVAVLTNNIAPTSPPSDILKFSGLNSDILYSVKTRPQFIPAKNFGDLIFVAMPQMAGNPEFVKMVENGMM